MWSMKQQLDNIILEMGNFVFFLCVFALVYSQEMVCLGKEYGGFTSIW